MKIWLIKIAEPHPFEGAQLSRTGSLAEFLSQSGHTVVWWKSTYSHFDKENYFSKTTRKKINPNEEVIFIHSPIVYKKNVSIERVIFYRIIAMKFNKMAQKLEKPDIILCAWPPAALAKSAIMYGEKNNIPVVLDARDMWPDIFERVLPKRIAKMLLLAPKRQAKKLFSKASGITAVQEQALMWACAYAGRKPGPKDKYFYIGSQSNNVPDNEKNKALTWLAEKCVTSETWNMCFWGSLRHSGLDLECVIKAVCDLEPLYPDIRLIIGGEGDGKEKLIKAASGSKAIVFLGFVNGYQMTTAMRICKLGIYSMINTPDFVNTISNKAIQYMSEGLPVLNSLTGLTKRLLDDDKAGITYNEGEYKDCMDKIVYLHNNEEERMKMSLNAKRLFENQFASDKINANFERYLEEIIGNEEV